MQFNLIYSHQAENTTFVIYVDASQYTVGGMVGYYLDNTYKVCGVHSKSLLPHQLSLSVHAKELLGVEYIIASNEPLLLGRSIDVFTDHLSLCTPGGIKNEQSHRHSFIWQYLSLFKISFHHIPGVSNLMADWLTRGAINNNLNQNMSIQSAMTLYNADYEDKLREGDDNIILPHGIKVYKMS